VGIALAVCGATVLLAGRCNRRIDFLGNTYDGRNLSGMSPKLLISEQGFSDVQEFMTPGLGPVLRFNQTKARPWRPLTLSPIQAANRVFAAYYAIDGKVGWS
jgi:hypothetical protein